MVIVTDVILCFNNVNVFVNVLLYANYNMIENNTLENDCFN